MNEKYSASVWINNDTAHPAGIHSPEFPTEKEAREYLANAVVNRVHAQYSSNETDPITRMVTVSDCEISPQPVQAWEIDGKRVTVYKHVGEKISVEREYRLVGVRS